MRTCYTSLHQIWPKLQVQIYNFMSHGYKHLYGQVHCWRTWVERHKSLLVLYKIKSSGWGTCWTRRHGHYIGLRAEAHQPHPAWPPPFPDSVTTTGRPNKVKLRRGDEIRVEGVKEEKCVDTGICMYVRVHMHDTAEAINVKDIRDLWIVSNLSILPMHSCEHMHIVTP